MNLKLIILITVLSFFSGSALALNVDEWEYKDKQGDLKPTPGCKTKEKASAQALKPYRLNKYAQILCQEDGYGWNLSEIKDKGTIVCDECGGDYEGKYRCYLTNVKVQCRIVKRGW